MMMASTVGTSVLSNAIDPGERGRLFKLANHRRNAIAPDDAAFLDAAAARAAAALRAADEPTCRRLSAEMNGILTYDAEAAADGRRPVDQHILVATDTVAGAHAAAVVDAALRDRGRSSAVLAITDLSTADLDRFRAGCSELALEMWKLVDDGSGRTAARPGELVFNLTGGFKGVNAFMQTVALALGAEAIYVFETSDRLMRIPRLPMIFSATEEIERAFLVYRRIDAGKDVTLAEAHAAGLSEPLLYSDGKTVMLSEYGGLLYRIAWAELAAKSLLEPRTDRCRFSERFRRDVDRLPGPRLRQVNEAVEAFLRRLEGKAEGRLGQYEFKPLKGDPKPPATHELYLWSDGGGTGRAFLRDLGGGRWEAVSFEGHL
jgi:putative CRISPR-associated protein (TIGR02619 family)